MSSHTGRAAGWPPGPCWIAVAAAALIGLEIGARVFATNDEARFPVLAQDILDRGDWLWPRLNGASYYNKPPLLAWLIALVSWPVGQVTQWTAILPSAAAAVATVLLVYALARDLFDAETGRFAALVAMTTQALFFHAHLALPDALMTCSITASVWMLVRMTLDPSRPWWIGFYGFTGAAFWAKGPAGFLPLAVGLLYGLVTRSRRGWSLRLVPGLPLLGSLVALWWLLGAISDSRAVAQAVITDQLGWYRPHGALLALLLAPLRNMAVGLFPWVLLAPFAIPAAVVACRQGAARDAVLLPLVWLGVTVALVALSHEQRLRYYLSVAPALAVILGWWLGAWLGGWMRGDLAKPDLSRATAIAVRRVLPAVWIGAVLAFAIGYHLEVARHNARGNYAEVAGQVRPLLGDEPAVVAWGIPELPLAFYLGRPVSRVDSESELRTVLERGPRAVVVSTETNWVRRGSAGTPLAAAPKPDGPVRVVLVRRGAKR